MQLLRDKIVLVMKVLSWVEQALVMGGLIQRASENTRIEPRIHSARYMKLQFKMCLMIKK